MKDQLDTAVREWKEKTKDFQEVESKTTLTRKGKTLYIVSEEARELRRIDRIIGGI